MINEIVKHANEKMNTAVEIFQSTLKNIRIGRASPSILNKVYIEYFGSKTSLRQVSNIIVEDTHTLRINVFDSSITSVIRKAILNSNLDLNPIIHGKDILVQVPALTEERRKNVIKVIRNDAETCRVSIRNIRREANEKLKQCIKEKFISKDEERIAQTKIQKMTDDYVKKTDSVFLKKEIELMKV
ncbi:ribosome recycling factor [Buchnera aphidicola (Hyadaphis tataricae)]|uniref:Ribosome-recycling factor n=1 Tax=Buchnera aphidicola (Hyadaphis tataricae) TaxID=1241859 RepID=A0A4D6XYD5_9GAMM|nr:ribosome recycling factor [Buchnera aphidicola]QCI21543.1 ribosome recycling factor [Buchnera aphidicola (Hyadaphis tataricae)]